MADYSDLVDTQQVPQGTLYVVATPIGNAADITLRALHILQIADAVACEDTRNTAQLLSRYKLHKTLLAVHEHNEQTAAAGIISRLQAGERIALVSDAGTPAISDPGAKLVAAVRAAGLSVVPLPGACAAVAALSVAGFPLLHSHGQFSFVGFLPTKAGARESALQGWLHHPQALVFYEAPHRIAETLAALAKVFPAERRLLIGREVTKLFEELAEMPLGEAAQWLAASSQRQRGEFVLVLEGAEESRAAHALDTERLLTLLLQELPTKSAAKLAAELTGESKNDLYTQALALKNAP